MKIVIVEDDPGIRKELKQLLENAFYEAEIIEEFKNTAEQICSMIPAPDLVLLDWNLPGESGFDICTKLKEHSDIPIIFLTSRTDSMDELTGILKGADDYITKPFSLSVLRARVNTQLRKAAAMGEKEKDNEHVYRKEPYVFDFDRMKFMVDGKEIELSKTEQKLLRILVENAGMNMRRELLLDRVWSDGAEYVDENALSVSIKRLRDKLGAEHAIRTVYGIGYRWE